MSEGAKPDRTWRAKYRAIRDKRREIVAALRNCGATLEEIKAALPKPPHNIINPLTNRPFGLTIISKDWKWLSQQWLENSKRSVEEYKANLLAEAEAMRRRGWQGDGSGPNYKLIWDSWDRRASLFNAMGATKLEVSGPGGGPLQIEVVEEIVDASPANPVQTSSGAAPLPPQ